jgi:Peptidase family M48
LIGRVHGVADALAVAPAIGRAALLLLPGMLAGMLLWAALARFHRRHAAAAACAALGAREPRSDDHEERQLGNVVAEMALAAGLPTPRLMLIDADQANAAAFGASHRDATLVVTRGLLDRLDRQETVGAVAHLVASAGNGDLGLAAAVLAVFQTLGAFLTLFDLPFRRGAWITLGGLAGACVEELPGIGDAVLRGRQLLLQRFHVFAGTEFRHRLCQREQSAHLLGQSGFGGSAGGHVGAGYRGLPPGCDDIFEDRSFVPHVAAHGFDQVGDQVGAAKELHVDLRPGVAHAIPPLHQAIIQRDRRHHESRSDPKHDPDHTKYLVRDEE